MTSKTLEILKRFTLKESATYIQALKKVKKDEESFEYFEKDFVIENTER